MERVGEHPVPAGPLAVRWLAYELTAPRAGALGAARVVLENAGSAAWRSRGREGVQVAYHWLDERGNAIVWDGLRTGFERPVEPGERVELATAVRAPFPPGRPDQQRFRQSCAASWSSMRRKTKAAAMSDPTATAKT